MQFLKTTAITSFAICAFSMSAQAAQYSQNFNVTAQVDAACSSLVPQNVDFGTYDPTSTSDVNVVGHLSATCSIDTPYNLLLNKGANGVDTSNRAMIGPNNSLLAYKIYRGSDFAGALWGETIGTDTISQTGTGNAQTIDFGAVLPAGQNIQPGSYSDTLTVTIDY
jgi:spore coat protein U-like protein